MTDDAGRPMWRDKFNERIWNPGRRAAGVTSPTRQDGTHALRHHFASVLLDLRVPLNPAYRPARPPRPEWRAQAQVQNCRGRMQA